MSYFNADGRRAEFCGNGARCLARRALDLGLGRAGEVRFRTDAGVQTRAAHGRRSRHRAALRPRGCAGAVGAARGRRPRVSRAAACAPVCRTWWSRWSASSGCRSPEWGSALRHHEHFAPAGTNVDFVARLGPARIAMRTYERGVEAETLACGSGAIASAACALADGAASPVAVVTAGGDELGVLAVREGAGWDVRLAGGAEVAFEGTWQEPARVVSSGGG